MRRDVPDETALGRLFRGQNAVLVNRAVFGFSFFVL